MAGWRGFLILTGEPPRRPDCLWATRVAVPGGSLWELAGDDAPAALEALLPPGVRIEAADPARGTRRVASIVDGRLAAVLFVTETGELPARDWLIAQLTADRVAPTVLAGRAPGAQVDRGAIVCACFDIGTTAILTAIRDQRLADVAAIGRALKAGTNCGSCRPALARLIADTKESVDVPLPISA